MSDAALRELERAAREGGDAAAWTRLALAQARAGLDGARAAVQALLRDPAAPVRELLVAGATPAPWALAAPAPFALRESVLAGVAPVDLGEGLALLPALDELVALDLFRGEVLWRQPRVAIPLVQRPALVGGRVVETSAEKDGLALASRSAINGEAAGTLRLPSVLAHDMILEPCGELLALHGDRCVAVVEAGASTGLAFCDLERGQVSEVLVGLVGPEEPRLRVVGDGLALSLDEELTLRGPEGSVRWAVRLGAPARLLAASRELLAVALGPIDGARLPTLVAATDGRRVSSLPAPFDAAAFGAAGLLVGAAGRRDTGHVVVEAWSSDTRRWQVALGGAHGSALTDLRVAGDLVLVTWSSAARAPQAAVEVTALDLATGRRLWSRVVDPGWTVALVGGCLLEVGPSQGWIRTLTPLRRLGPA